jgi:Flp pilus assembly protein TadG
MNQLLRSRKVRGQGASLIEFALVALLLCLLLLVFVDLGRLFLVYNSVANCSRAGVRYAIVHGSTRTAVAAPNGPSGPGNTNNVSDVVNNFAKASPLDVNRLTITVTYPGPPTGAPACAALNAPGCRVRVKVVYPYDPLMGYFPLSFNLGSTSEGVIAF